MFKHKLLLLISWLIRTILYFLPDEKNIMRLRGFCYSFFLPKCGKNFQVSSSVKIINLENLYIGDDVYLAPNVIINAITSVHISNEVMIGFNSVVVSGNHTVINNSYRFGESITNEIFIGFGSWIGANCTILAGTNIGKTCLIAANSSTRKNCIENSLYSGVPAKFVRKIIE